MAFPDSSMSTGRCGYDDGGGATCGEHRVVDPSDQRIGRTPFLSMHGKNRIKNSMHVLLMRDGERQCVYGEDHASRTIFSRVLYVI